MRLITKPNNEVLVCVFAHPDDESFLFGGTILCHTNFHIPTYLISVMGGTEPHRLLELQEAAKVLRVNEAKAYSFLPSDMCHAKYHELARLLQKDIKRISAKHPGKTITLLTLDRSGVSGHTDHIFVNMTTTYVFYRLPESCGKLMFYCKSRDQKPARNPNYFVYSPPGEEIEVIDESYEITQHWPKKRGAILCYKSQIVDQQAQLDGRPLSYFNPEHFIVLEQDYKGQKME